MDLKPIYNSLNELFYSNELPDINLIKSFDDCYGYFSWTDYNQYTIVVSEKRANNVKAIIETLHHETIHLYCKINNIKEMSDYSEYHNVKFKREAEKRGANYSYKKPFSKDGWSRYFLKKEALETILSKL